jgi:hypothetical protein
VSSISISFALRPLSVKTEAIARCPICHFLAHMFGKNQEPLDDAPHR